MDIFPNVALMTAFFAPTLGLLLYYIFVYYLYGLYLQWCYADASKNFIAPLSANTTIKHIWCWATEQQHSE